METSIVYLLKMIAAYHAADDSLVPDDISFTLLNNRAHKSPGKLS